MKKRLSDIYLNFIDIVSSKTKSNKELGGFSVCGNFGANDKTLSFWKRLFAPRFQINSIVIGKIKPSKLKKEWFK